VTGSGTTTKGGEESSLGCIHSALLMYKIKGTSSCAPRQNRMHGVIHCYCSLCVLRSSSTNSPTILSTLSLMSFLIHLSSSPGTSSVASWDASSSEGIKCPSLPSNLPLTTSSGPSSSTNVHTALMSSLPHPFPVSISR